MSLVSIIIPAYNAEAYIDRAIKSCLAQTYNDIEVIIIDNLSTDKTNNILKKREYYKKIHVYSCDKKGVSYARNVGIKKSSGRYICFLDADDELLPNSITSRVEALQATNSAVVSSDYLRDDGQSRKIIKNKAATVSMFNWCNPIGNLTGLYDIQKVGKVYQEPVHHEDYLMWWKIVKIASGKTCYVGETTAIYNVTPNSLSSSFCKNFIGHLAILLRHKKWFDVRVPFFLMYYVLNGLLKRIL